MICLSSVTMLKQSSRPGFLHSSISKSWDQHWNVHKHMIHRSLFDHVLIYFAININKRLQPHSSNLLGFDPELGLLPVHGYPFMHASYTSALNSSGISGFLNPVVVSNKVNVIQYCTESIFFQYPEYFTKV